MAGCALQVSASLQDLEWKQKFMEGDFTRAVGDSWQGWGDGRLLIDYAMRAHT